MLKREKYELMNFLNRIKNTPRIYKTHTDINYLDFFKNNQLIIPYFESLLQTSKIIYVSRNAEDTLVSLYFHYLKYFPTYTSNDINDFPFSTNEYHSESYKGIKNRIEYLKYHVSGWLNQSKFEILNINFEEIIRNYPNSIHKISNFIDLKPNELISDIRLTQTLNNDLKRSNEPVANKVVYTTESFRVGKIGDAERHFTKKTIETIKNKTKF